MHDKLLLVPIYRLRSNELYKAESPLNMTVTFVAAASLYYCVAFKRVEGAYYLLFEIEVCLRISNGARPSLA